MVSRTRSKSKSKKTKSRSRSRTKTIATLKPGMLTSFNYHVDLPVKERQEALKKAYKAYGYSTLIKRLNILAVYNKYKHPEIVDIVQKDMDFIRKLDEPKSGKHRTLSRSRSRTRSK
jgi:hypothetical protein